MKKTLSCLLTVIFCGLLALPVGAAEKPLSLTESIDLALHSNLDIGVANTGIDIAKAQLGQTKAQKGVNLGLTSSYMKLDKNSGEQKNLANNDSYSTQLSLTYPLYTGAKLDALQKYKEFNVETNKYGLETAKQKIIYGTKESYYAVLRTQHLVKVAQEYLDGMKSHLDVTKAMFKAGMVPKYDVLRAEVAVSDAQQKLITAKNNVELAKVAFNNVLNRPLNTPVELVDITKLEPVKNQASLADLVEKAYANRPEVASQKTYIQMADEGIKAAKADKMPTVSLTGGYNWNGDKFMDKNSWSVGIVGQFNILDGGLAANTLKEAEHQATQVQLQLAQTKQNVAYEVREAYLKLQEAKDAVDTATKSVAEAKEGLKIAEVRYKAGMGTSVERIDAQTTLTQAETDYTQAFYDYNLAKAQLEKAIGEEK